MIERYTLPQMGKIWGLENKFRTWLDVEKAICEAWFELGRIPKEDIQQIRENADFDLERIIEIEEKTKHDVIAFLSAVEEKCGAASRYIHLGCTSSDILDTANGLLLKQAGNLILQDLDQLLNTLRTLAERYKGKLIMGRTHGVHAEPSSLGLKWASFYAEFERNKERWEQSLQDINVGKISGAVGTYAHLTPEVERIACEYLGVKPDPISTQIVQRDRYANYFSTLAIIGGSIERLATELRLLQRTEVLEVEEGFSKGQKGSSAMPHKKNPISAENLCGLSRLVRNNSSSAQENQALWHERDISHSSVERVIMPDSTILIDYMLNRINNILENLVINTENMERNLKISCGLYFSQRVLLALIEKGMERQRSYELIQEAAMQSWNQKTPFEQNVRSCPEITKHFQESELEELFDNNYYLHYEDTIFKRIFNSS